MSKRVAPVHAPLKRLEWPWQVLVTVVSTIAWVWGLPWRLFVSLSPGFLKPYLKQLEDFATSLATPAVDFTTDTTRKVAVGADDLVDLIVTKLHYAYDATLERSGHFARKLYHNVEERVKSVEVLGWRGFFEDNRAKVMPPPALKKAKPTLGAKIEAKYDKYTDKLADAVHLGSTKAAAS